LPRSAAHRRIFTPAELRLAKGDAAYAVIKASDVMVAKD
jgi:molybdopterin-binding protein